MTTPTVKGGNLDMNKIKVAAYARVSTDKDDQANSFESQVKYFTDYINRQEDWKLVKVYKDEGLTGTSTVDRDDFNEMIADAMTGKIDVIITKEVSRFARNTLDSIAYTRKLKDKDVFVIFLLDGIDTRQADAELRLTIMSAIAQEESRKTSERVKWGQKRQMEKGVVFGRSMLGYKVEGGKLYLVEDEALIVQKIFYKYLNEGKGSHVIARELKEEGIKTYNPNGKSKYKNDWSTTVILRILRNEKYVGDLCQKKTYTKNYLDHKKRYNRGQEDMVYIKDHHPDIAIISREMWDAAQKELERRTTTQEQKSKHSNRYWASGKIFCGVCGERFVNKIKKTASGTSRAWNCMNHVKATAFRDKECDMSEWASDKSLKNIVLYILGILVDNKDELKKEILREVNGLEIKKKVISTTDLEKKIQKCEDKKLKLIDIRLSEEITQDEFKLQKQRLDNEIDDLQKQVDDLKEENNKKQNQVTKLFEIASEIDKILKLEDENLDLLLGVMTESITVFPGHTVEVRIKDIPFRFRVSYKSTGKLDTYRTEILSFEVV